MATSLPTGAALVDPIVDFTGIVILGASIYYISRQRRSRYPDVKNLLLLVYALFEGVLVLEVLRNFLNSDAFINVYAVAGISFVLWDVALLTLVGCLVYLSPPGPTFKVRVSTVFARFPYGFILAGFLAFILYSDVFVVTNRNAFLIKEIPNLFGVLSPLKTVAFGTEWLSQALIVLIVFVTYSTAMFVGAARKTADPTARKTLYVIPITWIVIGIELIVFNGFLVQAGHDLIGFGYIIAATAFGVTAYSFRDTSTVASFFGPIDRQLLPPANPFAARLGDPTTSGGIFLLETDPTSGFEDAIRDFAVEKVSNRIPVFVFSSKGDTIYPILRQVEGVRFYTFSASVSFPKPTDQPYEIMIPQGDQAILLDVIQKTVSASSEQKVAILYNSISDLIMSWGMEGCYKFLKAASELLLNPNVGALFLMTAGAHDEKTINLVRSIFPNQLHFDSNGLKVLKRV